MKKFIAAIFVLSTFVTTYAQVDLMGGMGISFQSTPSLKDYIDNLFTGGDELADFSSAVTFFFETDYEVNSSFDLGLEYEAKIYSYNTSFGFETYDLSYLAHSPSILGYYVLHGEGYKFKFGGGAGYRVISIDEQKPPSNQVVNYTATGFGLLLKAQAHTLLGGNFYAAIGADIRYDIIENSDLRSEGLNEEIDFNTLSVGLKLGVSYFIR